MKGLSTLLPLVFGAILCLATTGEEYRQKYLKSMEVGLKCHPGFKTLSPKIKAAAGKCAQKTEMASYMCFLTCMYREYGYLKKDKDELDFAVADNVTMESFDLTTQEGRDSYWKITINRYDCGNYVKTGEAQFALGFDDANYCAKATEFFKCQGASLFCNSENFSFTS